MAQNIAELDPTLFDDLIGEFTPEAALADQAAADRKVSGLNFYKMKSGRNLLRFLPPKKGHSSPFAMRWTHYLRATPNTDNKTRMVACLKGHYGKECPICEDVEALMAGTEADRALAKDMAVKQTSVAAVLDASVPIDPENPLATVFLFEFGAKAIMGALTSTRADEAVGGDYTHVLTGFPMVISKTGQGMQTEYDARPGINLRGPIHPNPTVIRAILEGAPDPRSSIRVLTAEEVTAALSDWKDECAAAAASAATPARGRTAQSLMGSR